MNRVEKQRRLELGVQQLLETLSNNFRRSHIFYLPFAEDVMYIRTFTRAAAADSQCQTQLMHSLISLAQLERVLSLPVLASLIYRSKWKCTVNFVCTHSLFFSVLSSFIPAFFQFPGFNQTFPVKTHCHKLMISLKGPIISNTSFFTFD